MTDLDAPFQLADMAPRRRRRWLLPLLVALAAVVLTGAVAAFALTRDSESATPQAMASPSVALLSERDACLQLNPLLLEASEMYAAFVKSNDFPKTDDARRVTDGMRALRKVAPADMGPDIDQIVKGLVLLPGGGGGIDFEDWQQAGLNLSTRCLGYGTTR